MKDEVYRATGSRLTNNDRCDQIIPRHSRDESSRRSKRRRPVVAAFFLAVAPFTFIRNDYHVSAAIFNPDESVLASLTASFRSMRKGSGTTGTTTEDDSNTHNNVVLTAQLSKQAIQDDSSEFSASRQFFQRQIEDRFPSLMDVWKQSQEGGWDSVLQSIRQQLQPQPQLPLRTDSNDIDPELRKSSDALEMSFDENAVSGWLDRLARSWTISTGWWTGLQTVAAWLSSYQVVNELAARWLSAESSAAIKSIREILSNAEDHGLVDVMGKYPPSELAASIFALSRLQHAAMFYDETKTTSSSPTVVDPKNDWSLELLQDLAHYAKFASAAYGWKMDLAFSGRLHLGDSQALLKMTDDVVAIQWQSRTHHPAYFIVREGNRKRIVLCIRGTWSLRDILTDLCCTAQDFVTTGGAQHRAHQGMLEAARAVADTGQATIAAELVAHPDYSLVVVGHSMGGGVAALSGILWEEVFRGWITVYMYGARCVTLPRPVDKFGNKTIKEFARHVLHRDHVGAAV